MAVWLFAVSLCASAADLRGTLVSGTDRSPLSGASVRLMRNNADSTFVAAVSAGNDGSFRLGGVARGKYIVSFTFLG